MQARIGVLTRTLQLGALRHAQDALPRCRAHRRAGRPALHRALHPALQPDERPGDRAWRAPLLCASATELRQLPCVHSGARPRLQAKDAPARGALLRSRQLAPRATLPCSFATVGGVASVPPTRLPWRLAVCTQLLSAPLVMPNRAAAFWWRRFCSVSSSTDLARNSTG